MFSGSLLNISDSFDLAQLVNIEFANICTACNYIACHNLIWKYKRFNFSVLIQNCQQEWKLEQREILLKHNAPMQGNVFSSNFMSVDI